MKSTCEKFPIFIGGGVLILHIGNQVPQEVVNELIKLKNDLQEAQS